MSYQTIITQKIFDRYIRQIFKIQELCHKLFLHFLVFTYIHIYIPATNENLNRQIHIYICKNTLIHVSNRHKIHIFKKQSWCNFIYVFAYQVFSFIENTKSDICYGHFPYMYLHERRLQPLVSQVRDLLYWNTKSELNKYRGHFKSNVSTRITTWKMKSTFTYYLSNHIIQIKFCLY